MVLRRAPARFCNTVNRFTVFTASFVASTLLVTTTRDYQVEEYRRHKAFCWIKEMNTTTWVLPKAKRRFN